MEIAVTGYNGFIGQRLVYALLKQGHVVYPIGREFRQVDCDRVYHLACPSDTATINTHPLTVMDTILDKTRQALAICPSAVFVNASSMGASDIASGPQGCYNVAKLCMEHYIEQSGIKYYNYRLPSVYGEGMNDSNFIKRCIDGTAYKPTEPDRLYYIAHVDDVVDALVNLTELTVEEITLGEIYESFNFGRRRLHRPTSC